VPAHHGDRAHRRTGAQALGDGGPTPDSRPSATAPSRPAAWDPTVVLTIAAKGEGVAGLVSALDRHHAWLADSGTLTDRRRARLLQRTREVVDRATRRWVWDETRAEALIAERLDEVMQGRLSPYDVAAEVLDGLKQGARL
jgi:GTPase